MVLVLDPAAVKEILEAREELPDVALVREQLANTLDELTDIAPRLPPDHVDAWITGLNRIVRMLEGYAVGR